MDMCVNNFRRVALDSGDARIWTRDLLRFIDRKSSVVTTRQPSNTVAQSVCIICLSALYNLYYYILYSLCTVCVCVLSVYSLYSVATR